MISPSFTSEPPQTKPSSDPAVFVDPASSAGPDDEAAQLAQDIAFAAAPFTWKGKQLAPFAISRESDWMLHRRLLGAPRLNALIRDPKSLWSDAIRVVWICLHEPEAWLECEPLPPRDENDERDVATLRALAVERQIRSWADANVNADDMREMVDLFFAVLNRAHVNHASAKSEGGGHGKKKAAPCPSPSPPTSPSSLARARASSGRGRSATTSRKSKAGATSTNGRSSKALKRSGRTSAMKT